MQDRELAAEAVAQAADELRREPDLRHEQQRLALRRERGGD